MFSWCQIHAATLVSVDWEESFPLCDIFSQWFDCPRKSWSIKVLLTCHHKPKFSGLVWALSFTIYNLQTGFFYLKQFPPTILSALLQNVLSHVQRWALWEASKSSLQLGKHHKLQQNVIFGAVCCRRRKINVMYAGPPIGPVPLHP